MKKVLSFISEDITHGRSFYRFTPLIYCEQFDEKIIEFTDLVTDLAVCEDGYLIEKPARATLTGKFLFSREHNSLNRLLDCYSRNKTCLQELPVVLFGGNFSRRDYLMFDGINLYLKNAYEQYKFNLVN